MVKSLDNINEKINSYINICLSVSKKTGAVLRNAHYQLGKYVSEMIVSNENLNKKRIAVVIMMRAGIPFGLGIADQLDSNNDVDIYFYSDSELNLNYYDMIIIADAVINTGKTIFKLINLLENKNVIIATNVISEKYIDNFSDYKVYSTRISSHSYKGSHIQTISNGRGPDTGDRLFSNSFYKM